MYSSLSSNLDAEIEAILFALKPLLCRINNINNVFLLIDSKSASNSSKPIHEAMKTDQNTGEFGKEDMPREWGYPHISAFLKTIWQILCLKN